MKKSKGQTIDLLYVNKNEAKKKTKNVGATSSRPKKKKNNAKKKQSRNNERINLDNEIIIGLTPKREENKRQVKGKKIKDNKNKINRNRKTNNDVSKSKVKKNSAKKQSKKSKKTLKIIKWTCIFALIAIIVILFMMSSIFNITQIIVSNNNKISSEEIIDLSTLTIGVNMFKTTNKTIRNNIKTNPYIEDVQIKRSLDGTVTLEVEERIPTYMLKFANSYVYINNQGYILEISETPLDLPIITGFLTSTENIKEGNRLDVEDLKKLEDVIKIMESAKNNSLADIITTIDISESTNYKLTIESELKNVQFGDATNINIKILKIEEVIQQEKGVEGEIYFQNLEKTVFREKV